MTLNELIKKAKENNVDFDANILCKNIELGVKEVPDFDFVDNLITVVSTLDDDYDDDIVVSRKCRSSFIKENKIKIAEILKPYDISIKKIDENYITLSLPKDFDEDDFDTQREILEELENICDDTDFFFEDNPVCDSEWEIMLSC